MPARQRARERADQQALREAEEFLRREAAVLTSCPAMPADPLPERREPERKAKSGPRSGLVFVVSIDALDHYKYLKRAFADDAKVAVIVDRRSRHRRKASSGAHFRTS
jgi:hypothetical protein